MDEAMLMSDSVASFNDDGLYINNPTDAPVIPVLNFNFGDTGTKDNK
jgi:hypothetical protein